MSSSIEPRHDDPGIDPPGELWNEDVLELSETAFPNPNEERRGKFGFSKQKVRLEPSEQVIPSV